MKKEEKKPDFHEPVMVSEVLEFLEAEKYAHLNNPCFVDATIGLGGHAKEFVRKGIFVVGMDADESALKIADEVLTQACPTPLDRSKDPNLRGYYKLLHGNFSRIDELVRKVYTGPVHGILFDLGISSFQLDDLERGFSFKDPEKNLDMRLDRNKQEVKANDLLAVLDKNSLTELFARVLTKGLAHKLSLEIVEKRQDQAINKVGDLLNIVKPLLRKRGKIDSATLPFLALRIAVNSEYENLADGIYGALNLLEKGGRIAVISFHSGEDRIVKSIFKKAEKENRGRVITKKPIAPESYEIEKNPRARSAKIRVFEKI